MKDPIEKRRLTMATTHGLKTLSLVSGTILAALYSQPGRAWTCTPSASSLIFNVGTVSVQRNYSALIELTPVQTTVGGYNCNNPDRGIATGIKADGTYSTLNINLRNIFKTNVPGIGYTLAGRGYWLGTNDGPYGKGTDTQKVISSASAGVNPGWSNFNIQIQLYKIGDIASGVLSGKIGALGTGTNTALTNWSNEIPITITGTITALACSLTNTTISVPLGDVQSSAFSGITTTAGDKTFNLGLSCDKDANINVALAGTQNMDTADTSVLALTNAGQSGTAKGVGVQLLYGGVPLKLNNNILLKTSVGGQETLPFSARYYQTQTAIGAGLANSSATLNITYQ
ncbi:fimbrial protein [Serratia quinivorans]|uniref:fimbrial protein n=1 Tax=Serratia quinivorans TaxID=137545 RepID=UPI0034C611E9